VTLDILDIGRVNDELHHASRDMRSPAWHYCIAFSSNGRVAIAKKSCHTIIGWANSQDEAVEWIEARERALPENERASDRDFDELDKLD